MTDPSTPPRHRDIAISVVVPTRDRPNDLAACLRSVVAADNGALAEIVLVDDASIVPAAVTADVERSVVIRHTVPLGPDQCRNEAVAASCGTHIAFLDDDARMAPDWFSVACRTIESGARAFTGRIIPFDSGIVSRSRQWRYDQRYSGLVTGAPVRFLAGGNSVVRREDFLAAGGFPQLPAGGDNGLVDRLAAREVPCVFVAELRVLHRNGKGLVTAARQSWRAGAWGPPSAPQHALIDCLHALRALRNAPLDVGAVNGALQLVHTGGRLVRRNRG
jgi:glycosyltransferase involved in cell wall biosynthesis